MSASTVPTARAAWQHAALAVLVVAVVTTAVPLGPWRPAAEVVLFGLGIAGALTALRRHRTPLVVVGRSSPLNAAQSAELAAVLTPAGDDHAWPDRIGTGRFGGGRLSVPLTRVRPDVVVEVSADAALQAGVFRHPLRFLRVRADLVVEDLPPLR